MKRFVIFELKKHKLTHQDIGQLDMYIRMYDDLVKGDDDNPTIGVLLCTDTDNTIAKYSVLHDSDQIFAAKYMTYMPTEEELCREIEQKKRFYMGRLFKEDKNRNGYYHVYVDDVTLVRQFRQKAHGWRNVLGIPFAKQDEVLKYRNYSKFHSESK